MAEDARRDNDKSQSRRWAETWLEDTEHIYSLQDNGEVSKENPICPDPPNNCPYRRGCLVREAIVAKRRAANVVA